jgi:hypothetical protein
MKSVVEVSGAPFRRTAAPPPLERYTLKAVPVDSVPDRRQPT